MTLISAEATQALPYNELIRSTADLIKDGSLERPEPSAIEALAAQGLNETAVEIAAYSIGLVVPEYRKTLADLRTVLPAIHQINDVIADTHGGNASILFAGRDAENLYDDFTTRHPDHNAQLLPASMALWQSPELQATSEVGHNFLSSFGIDQASLDDDSQLVLIDTGFKGSVAREVERVLAAQFPTSKAAIASGKLAVGLVCGVAEGVGWQMIADQDYDYNESDITKTPIYGEHAPSKSHRLAVSLQTMPRYHDEFSRLEQAVAGPVVARPKDSGLADTPENQRYMLDVDQATRINTSVINPVAAAIMQLAIVSAATERTDHLSAA